MFGFIPDPTLSVRHNAIRLLLNSTCHELSNSISHHSFHNLCDQKKHIPSYIRSLLGLGLNFTIPPPTPTHSSKIQLHRFEKDFYRRIQFTNQPFSLDDTDPNALFVSDPTWEPNTPKNTEFIVRNECFQLELKKTFHNQQHTRRKALLRQQENALTWLTDHPEYIVLHTDKNLGPAIMERQKYLDLAWRDHLSDTNTYQRLSEDTANSHISKIIADIHFFTTRFNKCLRPHEIKYITRLLEQTTITTAYSRMYLLAKIHKTPLKTRAIISYSGSICHGLAKWVDKELKKIVSQLDYVATDSASVVRQFTNKKWDATSLLFTCDAVSMYTNIHLGHALPTISHFLQHTARGKKIVIDHNIRVIPLIFALEVVMTNNIFTFGDTFWLQKAGTAMGTPPAPNWATLYMGIREIEIVPKYPELQLYLRYIDDGHGI